MAVMGVPVALEGVYPEFAPNPAADAFLNSLGLPQGVIAEFKRSLSVFESRTWIIDNSGSMATVDGHRIVTSGVRTAEVSASRWEELSDALMWHGTLAAELHAPTEFRLLNSPGGDVPQIFACGGGHRELEKDYLQKLVTSSPTGRTPLCHHIREVTNSIVQRADALRRAGKRHVVVIASDGAATDGDVADALRPLHDLPVWVVVRLCTDDQNVVDYWNQIDETLELDLDVLNDLKGEAKEVCMHSPWLTYGMPLHRLREWGTVAKIFDLLDERRLAAVEMKDLVSIITGMQDLPHPELNFNDFLEALKPALAKLPPVFDPIQKCRKPWIDMSKLRNQYRQTSGCSCTIL